MVILFVIGSLMFLVGASLVISAVRARRAGNGVWRFSIGIVLAACPLVLGGLWYLGSQIPNPWPGP